MAFDSLSDRLNKTMRNIIGKAKLSDANMEDMLKEVPPRLHSVVSLDACQDRA